MISSGVFVAFRNRNTIMPADMELATSQTYNPNLNATSPFVNLAAPPVRAHKNMSSIEITFNALLMSPH